MAENEVKTDAASDVSAVVTDTADTKDTVEPDVEAAPTDDTSVDDASASDTQPHIKPGLVKDENGNAAAFVRETYMMSGDDKRRWLVRMICLFVFLISIVVAMLFALSWQFALVLVALLVVLLVNEKV